MSCQKAVQASTSDWSSRKARGCLASLLGRLRKFLTNSLGKHCTLKKHAKNHLHFVVAVVNLVNVYWLQSVFSFHWSSLIFFIGGCLLWSTDIALSSLILPEDAEPFLMFSLIWSSVWSHPPFILYTYLYHISSIHIYHILYISISSYYVLSMDLYLGFVRTSLILLDCLELVGDGWSLFDRLGSFFVVSDRKGAWWLNVWILSPISGG